MGLHRFSLLVVGATFVLIVAGALVTSNDAGLAVPDWPLSFGRLHPPMGLIGNVFYEHGHRMIATTVGVLVILLNVYLWRSEPRRWVRRLGLLALAAVITQGLLGGLTVLLQLPLAV
ncbi:MAG TPA: COX15/CtaA family protein, partial [Pyrinomonadaceae bacterium]|nr:COX15/CtaA family protein [Pyrinomonadaceae bacterium]